MRVLSVGRRAYACTICLLLCVSVARAGSSVTPIFADVSPQSFSVVLVLPQPVTTSDLLLYRDADGQMPISTVTGQVRVSNANVPVAQQSGLVKLSVVGLDAASDYY